MSGINVRTTFHTDPEDPDGPCLFRLEVWAIPQEAAPGLAILLDAEVKKFLRNAGLAGEGETDLTTGKQVQQ